MTEDRASENRRQAGHKKKAVRFLAQNPESSALAAALVLVIVFAAASGGVWLNTGNLQSVLHVTSVLAILAIGEALVICTGEIDISIGSVFGIGAFVFLGFAPVLGVTPALFLAIGSGGLIGAFNGYVSSYLGVSSLITTLSTLFIFRGIAFLLTEGFAFSIPTATREELAFYSWFGSGTIFGFQNSIVWVVLLALVIHIAVFFTPFGNRLLAIGGHRESALSRGVRVRFVRLMAFVLAGALAAFAGVLEANKTGFADASSGRLMELEAIAACVVGGCLLSGGRVTIIGVVAGALILSSIQSFLVIMGVTPQLYLMVLAVLVIFALLGDSQFRGWAARQR